MEEPIVRVEHISKSYSLYKKKSDRLLEMFALKQGEQFSALADVSFDVYKGETIGIIGINGSGKSTLSNILAQIVPPTTGTIDVTGEVSLVAISAGLTSQLTGLENIELKCLMHGLTKAEINEVTPKIMDFADIGDFIHQPIKSYSSGMRARLGFSISIFVNPDILVIDEALSVGDSTFYQKCIDVFADYQKQGKTIFFISHSLAQVKKISQKIVWIHFGQVKMFGETEEVAASYQRFITWFNELSKKDQKAYRTKMLASQTAATTRKRSKALGQKDGSHGRKRVTFMTQLLLVVAIFVSSVVFLFADATDETMHDYGLRGEQDDTSTITADSTRHDY